MFFNRAASLSHGTTTPYGSRGTHHTPPAFVRCLKPREDTPSPRTQNQSNIAQTAPAKSHLPLYEKPVSLDGLDILLVKWVMN